MAELIPRRHKTTTGLQLDANEKAIVVLYDVVTTYYDAAGRAVRSESKPSRMKIRIRTLTQSSDVDKLAREVMSKCKLIGQSRLGELTKLLASLQNKLMALEAAEELAHDQQLQSGYLAWQNANWAQQAAAGVSIDQLDDLLEKLYDSVEDKIDGTFALLQLARSSSDNIQVMVQNSTLMEALSRTLREDARQSIDLATNIVYIFFCFSQFSELHETLGKHQVGTSTMAVVKLELKRYQAQLGELGARSNQLAAVARKQDQLLYLGVHLLLNLAEDRRVEQKMVKKGMLDILVACLARQSDDVLVLALTFLRKLSITAENKDMLAEADIVVRVRPLMGHANHAVVNATLRLLMNLSFDAGIRARVIDAGYLPDLVELLKTDANRIIALKVLYQLSSELECKEYLAGSDGLPLVAQLMIEYPGDRIPAELAALSVNLATHEPSALLLLEHALDGMMARAVRTFDPLLLKVVRNMISHETKGNERIMPYVPELFKLAAHAPGADVLVEALGILSSLDPAQGDFRRHVRKFQMVELCEQYLIPGQVDDDVLLEAVMFIDNLLRNDQCARLLYQSRVVELLVGIVADRGDDDEELMSQLTHAFVRIMYTEEGRRVLLAVPHAAAWLVRLLYSRNASVSQHADLCLDLVIEHEPEWVEEIKALKFRVYNVQWLRAIGDDVSDVADTDTFAALDDDYEDAPAAAAHYA